MKQEIMNDALLLGQFAEFIADRWLSGYPHSYAITRHRAWDSWRARHDGRSETWRCESLSQAARHWCWTESKAAPSFFDLATDLQKAIAEHNEAGAEELCYRIYDWGGVARREDDNSLVWVKHNASGGRLTRSLSDAAALLSPGSLHDLSRFNANDLLMTSATTKLYAATSPNGQVAIYDGRVGAGLGLLARLFLESRQIDNVPDVLHFMWGAPQSPAQAAARTRDPSSERHVFRMLPNGARSHRPRAELSRRTNVLFQTIVECLAARGVSATFLELERALFMIGYQVR